MALNYRRGFDRMFLVLSCGWAVFAIILPIRMRNDSLGAEFRFHAATYDFCLQTASDVAKNPDGVGYSTDPRHRQESARQVQQCKDNRERSNAQALRIAGHTPIDYTLVEWAAQAAFIVVPPAIVYALLLGVARVGRYVYDGFQTAT